MSECAVDVHRDIADYFKDQPLSVRVTAELPWQLVHGERYDQLRDYMTEVSRLQALLAHNELDAIAYWRRLSEHFDMSSELLTAVQRQASAATTGEDSDALYAAASLLQIAGRREAAVTALRCVLKVDERLFGSEGMKFVRDLSSLGLELLRSGSEEAKKHLQQAADLMRSSPDPDPTELAMTLNNLALYYAERGDTAKNDHYRQQALNILGQHEQESAALATVLYNSVARVEPHEAAQRLRRALAIVEKFYGRFHPHRAMYLTELADQLVTLRPLEAERSATEALFVVQSVYGDENQRCIEPMKVLAQLKCRSYKVPEGEALLRKAIQIELAAPESSELILNHLRQMLAIALLMSVETGGIAESKRQEAKSLLQHALSFWESDRRYQGFAKEVRQKLAEIG